MSDDRLVLRGTFDEDALLYDRARPGYPAGVFDAIFARLSHATRAQPRVLEIGCGTGQATRPLAQRSGGVLAVDLGADMAEVACRNLAPFANVEVIDSGVRARSGGDDPPAMTGCVGGLADPEDDEVAADDRA